MRVTQGHTDEGLARFMISQSKEILNWIPEQGVRFQPSLGGTLSLGRTNSFFLGGGRSMLNALYLTAERLGVDIRYDAEVTDLDIEDGMFLSATVQNGAGPDICPRADARRGGGGFEANIEWLKEYWGPPAENFLIRGTPYNRGTVLEDADRKRRAGDRRSDAMPCGGDRRARAEIRWRHHHAARLRRLRYRRQQECAALLRRGRGHLAEALRDLGTARRGAARSDRLHRLRCIFAQTVHAVAASRRSRRKASGSLPASSNSIPMRWRRPIATFNAAVRPGTFDDTILDDCRTEGISPPKSHWARRIETPPFYAYPVRPGITFTYLGDAREPATRAC